MQFRQVHFRVSPHDSNFSKTAGFDNGPIVKHADRRDDVAAGPAAPGAGLLRYSNRKTVTLCKGFAAGGEGKIHLRPGEGRADAAGADNRAAWRCHAKRRGGSEGDGIHAGRRAGPSRDGTDGAVTGIGASSGALGGGDRNGEAVASGERRAAGGKGEIYLRVHPGSFVDLTKPYDHHSD